MAEVLWERPPGCVCPMELTDKATLLVREPADECPKHGVLGAVPKRILDKALDAAMRAAARVPELQGVGRERIAVLLWAAAPYVREWVAAESAADQEPGMGVREKGA